MNDRWTMSDETPTLAYLICACCHEMVKPIVPKPDDDKGWKSVGRNHAKDCEWIRTRAFSRDVNWTK